MTKNQNVIFSTAVIQFIKLLDTIEFIFLILINSGTFTYIDIHIKDYLKREKTFRERAFHRLMSTHLKVVVGHREKKYI